MREKFPAKIAEANAAAATEAYAFAKKAQEAILALGDEVIAMGGSPLAEHGVGRNPIKQELLRRLYGSAGVDAMRAVKLSLDPRGVLAPGVVFPSTMIEC